MTVWILFAGNDVMGVYLQKKNARKALKESRKNSSTPDWYELNEYGVDDVLEYQRPEER